MVLLVSSFRMINFNEMELLVSSSHMQSSYAKAFSFFPHTGKTSKDVFCVFLYKVMFPTEKRFHVFICQRTYSSNNNIVQMAPPLSNSLLLYRPTAQSFFLNIGKNKVTRSGATTIYF